MESPRIVGKKIGKVKLEIEAGSEWKIAKTEKSELTEI